MLIILLGDHALVDLGCIGHFNPKLITVRSKSGDLLSNDSSAVPIVGGSRKRQLRVSITWGALTNYVMQPGALEFNNVSDGR